MARIRVYGGMVKSNKWYNYVEIGPMKGGVLAILDGDDKSGASKLLNLLKATVEKFYTSDGDELILSDQDYLPIKVIDAWKIAYEQIKIVLKNDYPVIDEHFYCSRCSRPGYERYTDVKESWQKLIDDGLIDEFYLEEPKHSYIVTLPDPIEIQSMRTIAGGVFDQIEMKYLTIGDAIKIQNNPDALANEITMVYATWDTQIIQVIGMPDRDFNVIKRAQNDFFSKKYLNTKGNQEAIIKAEKENMLGIDASDRSVMCKHCGFEIGGLLDQTNFFSPLLPTK